jgi:hypothetical protein
MPSHLIIGTNTDTFQLAQSVSPQKIAESPDCLVLADDEESLKISQVRDIKHFLTRKPYGEDSMVVFVPEAHRLTIPAQNALLKTLEEPPEHAILILTTPYEDRLLPTVISRCIVHHAKSNHEEPDSSIDTGALIETLKTASVGEKMAISQGYAFPKPKALVFCKSLIDYYRKALHTDPHHNYAKNIALAQQTITSLEQNVDPRLSVEHLFLNLLV